MLKKLDKIEIALLVWFFVVGAYALYVAVFMLGTEKSFYEVVKNNTLCFGALAAADLPILIYEAIKED